MPEIHQQLAETTIDGPRSRCWAISAKECPELAASRISRIGFEEAIAPYRRVRLRPGGSFFLDSVEGGGRILLDGRWRRLGPGSVCMAPPRVLNAFQATGGDRWVFAWVRYDEPPWIHPMVNAGSPVRAVAGAGELARIVAGLRAEWEGARDPQLLHHWISLLHATARRLAQPWRNNERLSGLWREVGARLAEDWTLTSLARQVHLSSEHLRRLCLRELGRSPMQHLAFMRIQRAQDLLESTDDKLEAIAPEVGYHGALVLSRAFKRWVGLSPTEYRQRRG